MKSLTSFCAGLFIWLALGQYAQATHLMGSDILYRCKGNGKYDITVRVYRDCNGVQISQSPIVVSCGSTVLNINTQTKVSVRDITGMDPSCPIQSRCVNQWTYGIEEHIWTAEIDLSSYQCCEWTISWQQSARNSNISIGAANQNFYTFATLNKCVTPCNSSPDFTNPPIAIVCRNQDFVFNNGALDTVDVGDSLSYHLVPALQAAGQSVTYNPPYSYQYPISTPGGPAFAGNPLVGFALDPVTGDIQFRPTQSMIGIVVVEVREWRMVNGVMTVVGVTRRDMQIIVIPCPNNNVPRILPPYSAQACAGQQTCLTITTDDNDFIDTVKISWNKGIKGATFTNNNGSVKHASGQVCWTPTEADVSNVPYTFTITAKDNSCNPFPGQSVRAFSVFVRATPDAEMDLTLLTCGKVAVHHQPKKQYPGGYQFTYTVRDSLNKPVWSGTKQSDTIFLQPGRHTVFLTMRTNTPCIKVITDTIVVPDFVTVRLPEDTLVCDGIPVNVMSKTKGGNSPYEYEWALMTDSGAGSVLSTAPDLQVDHDSFTRYLIRVRDANNCRNYDTIGVGWHERPVFNLGTDERICYGSSVTLTAQKDSTHTFLWSTGETFDGIDVRDSNTYWVKVTDSVGCWFSDTQNVFVNRVYPKPGMNRFICENEQATFTATGADTYQWYLKEGFSQFPLPAPVGTGANFQYTITKSTGFVLRGTQTYQGVTCVGYDSVEVTMNPLPPVVLQTPAALCVNAVPLSLLTLVDFPTLFTGTWRYDANPTAVSNGVFYPAIAGVNTAPGHSVTYRVTDHNGCSNELSIPVKVNALPEIVLLDSVAVCGDLALLDLNNLKVKPNVGATQTGVPNWYSMDNLQAVNNAFVKTNVHDQKLKVNQLAPASYYLVFEFTHNVTKCRNADTVRVRVKPIPNTDAGTLSPPCWSDGPIDLNLAANASPSGGTWYSPELTMNGTSFLPASVGIPGKHVIPGTDVRFIYRVEWEGCPKTDTLYTRIKGIPDLQLTEFDGWCSNAGIRDLAPLSNIPGGTWSGPGVSGTSFDPMVAGTGTSHLLKYRVTNPITACPATDSFMIEVQAAPQIELVTSDKACAGMPYHIEVKLTNASTVLLSRNGDGEFDSKGSGNATSTFTSTDYFPGNGDNTQLEFTLLAQTTNNRYCNAAQSSELISIFPLPGAVIEADPMAGCDPLPVHFNAISDAAPGAEFEWDFGNGTTLKGSDDLRSVDEVFHGPGTYTVRLKVKSNADNGACEQEAQSVRVDVWPTPVADFTVNRWKTTVALPGIQFTDRSVVDAPALVNTWNWTFGDKNNSTSSIQHPYFEYPTSEPMDTGTFLVTLHVRADNGCDAIDSGEIHIAPDMTVFIPNAFSPNGFGEVMNNRYYVIADGFETFQITIFTRWGEKVYHSANIKEGWDGKYKGMEAQQDVYMYIVKLTAVGGKEYEYSGTITLLR